MESTREGDHYISAVNQDEDAEAVGLALPPPPGSVASDHNMIVKVPKPRGRPKKIYADLDAMPTSTTAATTSREDAEQIPVIIPPEVPPGTPATEAFMPWTYLESVEAGRGYEIPVHIDAYPPASPPPEIYGAAAVPHGFTPQQQYPIYHHQPAGVAPLPPPPPPPPPLANGTENQSILIQRIPHRQRKGRGRGEQEHDFLSRL